MEEVVVPELQMKPVVFLAPAVTSAVAPRWEQFVLRFAASLSQFRKLTVQLLEVSASGLLDGLAVGSVSLDMAQLIPPAAAEGPLTRSFFLDLHMPEFPQVPASFELEARVWPRLAEKEALAF